MIYYFSGAAHQEIKREMNVDQLFSAYHEKKLVENVIKYKKENPDKDFHIMLDSGAFSHYMNSLKKGIKLTDEDMYAYTDEYLKFLDKVGDDLTCFVAVDSVPNPAAMDYTLAEKTWKNYLYMYDRIRPENRDKLIPVFHFGEDFKWLKQYLEYRHADGSPIDYIGLAISLEGTRSVRIKWALECEKIIRESSNPNVKTHAFGVGVKSVLEHIHVTSTDATSWVKRAAFGMIAIDDKSVVISSVQRDNPNSDKYYGNSSMAYTSAVEDVIKERGYTLEDLQEKTNERVRFNIDDTLRWVKELNDTQEKRDAVQKLSMKKSLW